MSTINVKSCAWAALLWVIFVVAQVHHAAANHAAP